MCGLSSAFLPGCPDYAKRSTKHEALQPRTPENDGKRRGRNPCFLTHRRAGSTARRSLEGREPREASLRVGVGGERGVGYGPPGGATECPCTAKRGAMPAGRGLVASCGST